MIDLKMYGGGETGASAYDVYREVAEAQGNAVLSKSAWLASLVGPVGVDFDPAALAWDADITYPVRAGVTESGSSWLALRVTTGERPSVTPDAWGLLVAGIDADLYEDLLTAATEERESAGVARAAAENAAEEATDQASAATAAAGIANAAADAAMAGVDVYASTSAGLAGTAIDGQFMVVSGVEIVRYRHDAGPVATELARYPSAAEVESLRDRAQHTGTQGAETVTETPSRKLMTASERQALAPMQGRDGVGAFVWAVRDPTGRALGFDAEGVAVAAGLDLRRHVARDAVTETAPLVRDEAGGIRVRLDAAGRVVAYLAAPPLDGDRDHMREAVPVLTALGNLSLLVVRDDGLDLAHSAVWRRRLAAEIAADAPAFDTTARRAFHVRRLSGYLLATTQLADGYVGEIVQVPGRSTAVPYTAAPLIALHVTGQSNAGAGPGPVGQPPITGVLAQDHLLRTDLDDYSSGSVTEVPGAATDFVTATEPRLADQAQAPAAMAGYGIYLLGRRAGRECPGLVISTAWQGGQTIDKFFPDAYPSVPGSESPLYENLYAHVANTAAVAEDVYGREVEHNILWVQGEGDTDYASYRSQMELWIATVLPTFAAVSSGGAVPHMFLMQTQTGTAADVAELGSGAAQLQVARDHLGDGVTMVGPMYQGAVHDNIHHTNLARMMMGELVALAYERVRVSGETFHPLWPVAGGVTRAGAVITVPLSLPPGAASLAWDSDWVATIADKGFWFDDDSGSPPSIASVAISGTSVIVTLSAVPAGPDMRLGYGTKKLTETAGWASSRGLLYADSGVPSPFAALGYAIPATIRHYCVRFTESLA
jgi:hypothetical protein